MRRHWRKWLLGIAIVYVLLWVATAIWGPTAMAARQRVKEEFGDLRSGMPYPENDRKRLHDFVVSAPFVVMANWEYGGEAVGQMDFSRGKMWGLWLPVKFWVVQDHATMHGCG